MGETARRRLSLAAAAALAMAVAAHEAASEEPCGLRCVLVRAIPVKAETYARKATLTGDIEPQFSNNIAFRISGKIEQRLVEIGDHITADQVLARLDPQVQKANLEAAKASLASAEALLTQAQTTFNRQAELLKSGFTTRKAYDEAEQQLRSREAAVASAKAAVGTAEEQLGYAELKAGVAGIITARNAETGQVVQAGQTVFTVAQDGPRDAVFEVYEALLSDPPDRTVKIFLQADPSVVTTGTVREVAPTIDPAAGTVKVKVGLDSVPAKMSLGAVIVGVGSFPPRPAVVLPRSALFRWEDSPAIWVLDPKSQTVAPKVVTIERYAGDQIVLSHGVAPGETVVTAGIQFLRPGQRVEIATGEPTP